MAGEALDATSPLLALSHDSRAARLPASYATWRHDPARIALSPSEFAQPRVFDPKVVADLVDHGPANPLQDIWSL